MGKVGTVLAIILVVGIAGYFLSPVDIFEYLPFDPDEITTRIDAVFQQSWKIGIDPISDISNQTAALIENRTGLTLDISKKEKEIEEEVHRLVNIQREIYDLESLEYDDNIAAVAKLHSLDMAKRDFFSHENPDGQTPTDRASELEYYCIKINAIYVTSGIGENIFMLNSRGGVFWQSVEDVSQTAVEGWMKSPGHRENILKTNYDSEGIGVIISDRSIHVTQNFC